jgi:hypothetical protein
MRIQFESGEAVILPLFACGWGYANAGCKLHQTARDHQWTPVCNFFASREAEGTTWFSVEEALASVRGLQAILKQSPGCVCDAECSLRDLHAIENTLSQAPVGRFRLSILSHQEQQALAATAAPGESNSFPS